MGVEDKRPNVIVIGGGFTGLSTAYELAKRGVAVTVLEKQDKVGGISADFEVNGCCVDKFYHHFFNSDEHLIRLAGEIGFSDRLIYSPTKTSVYIDGNFYRLSSPLDVLRFGPLGLIDRIRLGILVLRARGISDWRPLESETAEQWLIKRCGKKVYTVVWEPLLRAKFGSYAHEVSAVWFWNKIVLRGGSRNKAGSEVLGYIAGSFGAMAEALADKIRMLGGEVLTGKSAESLVIKNGSVRGVRAPEGAIEASTVIATPALPIIADLLEGGTAKEYIDGLRHIKYMANVCLVLELSKSLSDIYWLNINDPEVPFTGIIEHTNLLPINACGGRHIVYLSKYTGPDSDIYNMSDKRLMEFSLPYIERIFAGFNREQVLGYHVFKEAYAQPLIERNYSNFICRTETPVKGFYIATMAQVYPQDRGVNYAVRQGKEAALTAAEYLDCSAKGK
jgi:protoporphyrinogen oxidase